LTDETLQDALTAVHAHTESKALDEA